MHAQILMPSLDLGYTSRTQTSRSGNINLHRSNADFWVGQLRWVRALVLTSWGTYLGAPPSWCCTSGGMYALGAIGYVYLGAIGTRLYSPATHF